MTAFGQRLYRYNFSLAQKDYEIMLVTVSLPQNNIKLTGIKWWSTCIIGVRTGVRKQILGVKPIYIA